MNSAAGKIRLGGKGPQKCIHSVPAQKTAKHCAKFSWPPVSDIVAVTKPRRNKSSAVAEMGDSGHNRHGPKRGGVLCPFCGALGIGLIQCGLR